MSLVMDCPCGHQLRAEDDAVLFSAVKDHAERVHPEMKLTEGQLRDKLAAEAYREGPLTDRNALDLVRRAFHELWEKGNLGIADELYARDYHNHDPVSPELPPGPDGVRETVSHYRAAFPDQKFTLLDTIVAGDRVVVRWTVEATHTSQFAGAAPTGKKVQVTGISIMRIENGKIAEGWGNWDTLGLLQRIGALPAAVMATH